MAKRLTAGRTTLVIAIAVVLLIILGGWVFLSPRPERTSGFGLGPPRTGEVIYASLGLKFPGSLHRLVTLESVRFEDATGHYRHGDAWVYPGGGTVVGARDIPDYFDLREPRGYRFTEPAFGIMLQLEGAKTPSGGFHLPAGGYGITLDLRFAGRPYTHRVQWPGSLVRWERRDSRIPLLAAASLAMVGAWLFLAPAPRLIRPPPPAAPGPDRRTADASFDIWFANPLRYLATLEWVHFVDPSGRYRQEEAWVDTAPAGEAGVTRGVGRSRRVAPGGLRLARRLLRITLRLREAEAAPGGPAEAYGPYQVILGMSFAGRPYTSRLEWPSRG